MRAADDVWRQRTTTATDMTSAATESTNPPTAVSLYVSRAIFDPTESTPLDRSPKNLLLVITSATANGCAKFVEKSVHGGLLGKWVKYDIFKIYLYLFS